MSTLMSLQNQFQNYLLAKPTEISHSIVHTDKVPVDKRLSIYLDAYRYRLLDILKS